MLLLFSALVLPEGALKSPCMKGIFVSDERTFAQTETQTTWYELLTSVCTVPLGMKKLHLTDPHSQAGLCQGRSSLGSISPGRFCRRAGF